MSIANNTNNDCAKLTAWQQRIDRQTKHHCLRLFCDMKPDRAISLTRHHAEADDGTRWWCRRCPATFCNFYGWRSHKKRCLHTGPDLRKLMFMRGQVSFDKDAPLPPAQVATTAQPSVLPQLLPSATSLQPSSQSQSTYTQAAPTFLQAFAPAPLPSSSKAQPSQLSQPLQAVPPPSQHPMALPRFQHQPSQTNIAAYASPFLMSASVPLCQLASTIMPDASTTHGFRIPDVAHVKYYISQASAFPARPPPAMVTGYGAANEFHAVGNNNLLDPSPIDPIPRVYDARVPNHDVWIGGRPFHNNFQNAVSFADMFDSTHSVHSANTLGPS